MPVLKVEGPKSGSAAGPVRRTGGASGPSAASGKFAAELDKVTGADETAEGAAAVEGTSGVVGVGGILAAQTVSDQDQNPNERRRRALGEEIPCEEALLEAFGS